VYYQISFKDPYWQINPSDDFILTLSQILHIIRKFLNMLLKTFLLVLLLHSAYCFYVPGVAPVEYKNGDSIVVKVVKMTSTITQLPYSYYSLPFCKPNASKLVYKSENLGEILRGDRIVTTPFEFNVGEDQGCTLACNLPDMPLHWTASSSSIAFSHIFHQYYVHM